MAYPGLGDISGDGNINQVDVTKIGLVASGGDYGFTTGIRAVSGAEIAGGTGDPDAFLIKKENSYLDTYGDGDYRGATKTPTNRYEDKLFSFAKDGYVFSRGDIAKGEQLQSWPNQVDVSALVDVAKVAASAQPNKLQEKYTDGSNNYMSLHPTNPKDTTTSGNIVKIQFRRTLKTHDDATPAVSLLDTKYYDNTTVLTDTATISAVANSINSLSVSDTDSSYVQSTQAVTENQFIGTHNRIDYFAATSAEKETDFQLYGREQAYGGLRLTDFQLHTSSAMNDPSPTNPSSLTFSTKIDDNTNVLTDIATIATVAAITDDTNGLSVSDTDTYVQSTQPVAENDLIGSHNNINYYAASGVNAETDFQIYGQEIAVNNDTLELTFDTLPTGATNDKYWLKFIPRRDSDNLGVSLTFKNFIWNSAFSYTSRSIYLRIYTRWNRWFNINSRGGSSNFHHYQ